MKPNHESITFPCGIHAEFEGTRYHVTVRVDQVLLPSCKYGEPTVTVNIAACGPMSARTAMVNSDVIRAAVQWGEETLAMRVMPAYQAHLAGDNAARCRALGIEAPAEV